MNFIKDLLCITYRPKKAINDGVIERVHVRSATLFISLVMSVISFLIFIDNGYEFYLPGMIVLILPMLSACFVVVIIISAGFLYLIDKILAKGTLGFRNCCKAILPEHLVVIPFAILRAILLYAGMSTTGILYIFMGIVDSVWGIYLTIYYLKNLYGYDKRPLAVLIGISVANMIFAYGSQLIEAMF